MHSMPVAFTIYGATVKRIQLDNQCDLCCVASDPSGFLVVEGGDEQGKGWCYYGFSPSFLPG